MAKIKTPSALRSYLDECKDLPNDVLLGRIVFSTIYDTPVKRSDMEQWFIELGLDTSMLPVENKRFDAFRKATSAVKDVYPMSKGRTGLLLCRDVVSNGDFVRRWIVREIRDSANKRLNHDGAIEVTFYRPLDGRADSARLVTVPNTLVLEPDEVDRLKAVAQKIYADYVESYDFMDGQKLRATVRRYLKHLNALEIKGGVYFVHATRDKELADLSELISRFGGGCEMKTVPLVDLESERKYIGTVFEREASQALLDLQKEAQELMATRKTITPAAVLKLRTRYDETMAGAAEHMATLNVTQDVTAAAAELALEALLKLQEEMIK